MALLLLLQTSEPHESELASAAQASRARTSLASVVRARRGPLEPDDAGVLPPPGAEEEEEEHTTGSSSSSGEEPLLAAVAPAAAPALFPLRSFDGVFAAAAAAAVAVRSESALLSLAETEGDADGLMLQVLLLLLLLLLPPGPTPNPRCGVEWPESGMEQEGGAEAEELGASGGRRLEEVEAATPACCCWCWCCEEGDADDVVEVGASALSIPPLLAPRRCVAVVAVPIRQDAEPPSKIGREVEWGEREKNKVEHGDQSKTGGGKTDDEKRAALACFLSFSQPFVEEIDANEASSTDSIGPESLRSTARSILPSQENRTVRGQRHAEAPASSAAPVSVERHHRRRRRSIDDDAPVIAVGHRDRRRRGGQGRPRQSARRGEAEVRPHAGEERVGKTSRKPPGAFSSPSFFFFFSLVIANGLD